jgi:hemerythrin-like domain-containing protein
MTPAKSSKSPAKSKKESTFFDILKQDHDKIRDIFEQIEEDEGGENRQELFAGLQSELQEHLDLEEKTFYPQMEKSEDLRDKALEAYEEHHVAKMVLGEFTGLDIEDDRWDAKLKVLQEVVNHHLQEEEKNIFKLAKKSFEPDQIKQVTDQVLQMKSEKEKKAA